MQKSVDNIEVKGLPKKRKRETSVATIILIHLVPHPYFSSIRR
jgi:hypothetical protein